MNVIGMTRGKFSFKSLIFQGLKLPNGKLQSFGIPSPWHLDKYTKKVNLELN